MDVKRALPPTIYLQGHRPRLIVSCFGIEWDDCDPSGVISELPDEPAIFWDRSQENLLVCDEIPWEQLSKADKMKADRCLMNVCSHYSVSCYVLHQNFVSIPTPIRRACDWWVLWGSVGNVSVRDVLSKTGHDARALLRLKKSKCDCVPLPDSPTNGSERHFVACATTHIPQVQLDRVLFYECDHRADELIGLKVDVSGEFIAEFELVFVQEA